MDDGDRLAVWLTEQFRTAVASAPVWQRDVLLPALDRITFQVVPPVASGVCHVSVMVDCVTVGDDDLGAADLAGVSRQFTWELVGALTLTASLGSFPGGGRCVT